jgi:hypothetical protein
MKATELSNESERKESNMKGKLCLYDPLGTPDSLAAVSCQV